MREEEGETKDEGRRTKGGGRRGDGGRRTEDEGRGTDADRAAIIREIAELCRGTDRTAFPQPNFTRDELARELGITPDAAAMRLKRLVRQGSVQSGLAFVGNHWRLVYWKTTTDLE